MICSFVAVVVVSQTPLLHTEHHKGKKMHTKNAMPLLMFTQKFSNPLVPRRPWRQKQR